MTCRIASTPGWRIRRQLTVKMTIAGSLPATPSNDLALRISLRRQAWRKGLVGMALVAPMLLFTLLLLGYPLVQTLWLSVGNPEIVRTLPHTVAVLRAWDGSNLPPDAAFDALAGDLRAAAHTRTVAIAAVRLNYEQSGMRRLLMRSAAMLAAQAEPAPDAGKALLQHIDRAWSEPATWQLLRRAVRPFTLYYLLAAIDLRQETSGAIVATSPDQAIFLDVLCRTLWISLVCTLVVVVLGFPVAYLLASATPRWRSLLMILVLLPFWTSLLVRICAWIELLQKAGVINSALLSIGVIEQPLKLLFNHTGVYVTMVHILLPYMIFPIYSVMRRIPITYIRAAASLGASPVRGFITVYMPQAFPGVAAGCSLVYILSCGYYVTQELVGGPHDQMISYYIAFFTNQTVNWGMASALAVVLMLIISLLYAFYRWFTGMSGGPRLV